MEVSFAVSIIEVNGIGKPTVINVEMLSL
jgi:hypothetical protein